ncbi:UPF0187 protein [Seminavis robusta]|uniref:UPF0187 protein n=1 Tax=Seminavis robusta TaxID=568900 RepID=A0A9N8H7N4_9STRA|nr:UPF0187 protein [Seminavis robusta]|eukprot:Sro145_g067250.1 UPF0187 protein (465) ;mRNA; f:35306-36790
MTVSLTDSSSNVDDPVALEEGRLGESSNKGNNNSHSSKQGSSSKLSTFFKKTTSVIGNQATFLRTEDEHRERRRQLSYEPTHHWWEPPLRAWIPQCNREILLILVVYNTAVTVLARYSGMCGNPSHHEPGHIFCSDDWILLEDKALVGFAVGMFLLLAFRSNQAYERFWEGRRLWGRTREVCRDYALQVCSVVRVETEDDKEDRRRAVDYLTAFGVAMKLHLRGERHIVSDLSEGTIGKTLSLTFQDIANIQQAKNMPLFCLDVLSDYLNKQQLAGKLSDYQLGIINVGCLSVMSDTLGSCERIRNTPIPLSYVLQLRFFLILWLVLYPLHVVAFYGWFTIVLANLVSYAVLGIESMASEIENPFGNDKNDLDLDEFCLGFCEDTHEILRRHESEDREMLFDRRAIMALDQRRDFRTSTRKLLTRQQPPRQVSQTSVMTDFKETDWAQNSSWAQLTTSSKEILR